MDTFFFLIWKREKLQITNAANYNNKKPISLSDKSHSKKTNYFLSIHMARFIKMLNVSKCCFQGNKQIVFMLTNILV